MTLSVVLDTLIQLSNKKNSIACSFYVCLASCLSRVSHSRIAHLQLVFCCCSIIFTDYNKSTTRRGARLAI